MKDILPNNLDAEKSVLGAMLISEKSVVSAMARLSYEDFYSKMHQNIFSAMLELFGSSPIDIITVLDRMTKLNCSDEDTALYLSDLTQAVPSVSNIEYYINIIEEKSSLRRLISAGQEIVKESFDCTDDAASVVNRAHEAIYSIAVKKDKDTLKHIKPALIESYNQIAKTLASKSGILGISTGFKMLDMKLSGLQGSQLIVIAGRPGMGKTSFAMDIVRHTAIQKQLPCAIFSLEMSAPQISSRLMCSVAQIDMQDIRNKSQNTLAATDKLIPAMELISSSPIYIDDSPGMTVTEMVAKARKLKIEHGLSLIMIDYLQLMNSNSKTESRQLEISEITRNVKIAARELDVPILLLSQLSRASERRGGDKMPILSDLRESGSIEQDADVVIFIHRENYYDETADNTSKLIIAKQRMGPTGTVNCKWVGSQSRFAEIEDRIMN